MEISMPPTRVTEAEVNAMCVIPDSGPCARLKEQRAVWQAWERQRDAEEAQLRAAREAKQAAAEKERKARDEAALAVARAAEDDDLRRRLRVANPVASPAEIEALVPELRQREMLRRTEADRDREVEAYRQRAGALSF